MGRVACTQLLLGFWCLFPRCVPSQRPLAAFAAAVKHHCAKTLHLKGHPHNICLFLISFAVFHTLLLRLAAPKAPRESPLCSFYLLICPGIYMTCTNSHQPWAGVVRAVPRVCRLSCTSGGSVPGSGKPCGQFGQVAFCS